MMSKSSEQEIDYLNQVVYQLYQQGQYNKGLDLALQVREKANQALDEGRPQYAMALNNLGILYLATGNPAAAEPILQQALEVRRKSLGEYDPYSAQSLNSLAELYRQIGNYAAAEPLYKQAPAIRRRAWGDNHPGVATILNNLGLLYQAAGNYTAAEPLLLQALPITRDVEGEDSLAFAQGLNNLGVLYRSMHNYSKAESLYRQALEIRLAKLGETNPLVATSLDNLAELSRQIGSYTEAEQLFLQAQKILRSALGENHPDVATNLNNLGELYRDIGSYAKAETYYLQALQIWETVHYYSSLFMVLNNLGLLYQGIGQYELAEMIHKATLDVRRKVLGENHPDVALSLNNLAALYEETGNYAAAEPLYRQALELRRRSLPENHSDIAQSLNNLGVLYLSMGNYSEAAPFLRQALEIYHAAERERPLDLVQALFKMAHLSIATYHTDEAMERAGMRHAGPTSNHPDEDAFLQEGRALRAIVFDPLITAVKGSTRLFLAPDGDLTRVPFEVLPTNDDRYLIDDYHISYLSVGRDALRFNRASTRQVSTPLVIAAPDFDLSNADEGTAPTQDQPYARQSRDLERNKLHFSPLLGTSAEGKQIALYLGTQPLLGRAAVKVAIENCHSLRILHIATHGFFLPNKKPDPNDKQVGGMVSENMGLLSATPENPLLRSGLALAGANTWQHGAMPPSEAENGLLTAEDVSGLDLLGTELAVLSACDTGLGQIHTGEGVLGLRRSFMLAGTKTLVMSLWKVPDQQTQELMVDFYRRLLEDHPRLDALQESQKALRAKYPHPRYWGAFILQGNPDPLAF